MEYKEIFEYFDTNKDGKINLNDMEETCKIVGLDFNKNELGKLFESIQPGSSNELDFELFTQLMDKKLFPEMGEKDLLNSFKVFDKNNSGRVNSAEFQQLMSQVVREEGIMSTEEVKEFMNIADPNNDGYFDYKNFVKLLNE